VGSFYISGSRHKACEVYFIIPLNTITITITHPKITSPKYTFRERVALKSNGKPQNWARGIITGLRLDDYSANTWNYTVVLDFPQGYCEELVEEDLVAEAFN
jgi:hypothetical protein